MNEPERERYPVIELRDVVAIVGLGMIFAGLYLIDLAYALAITGAFIFLLAVRTPTRPPEGD